jgi:pimeloyl-ACP methyl ester carboxylesterase
LPSLAPDRAPWPVSYLRVNGRSLLVRTTPAARAEAEPALYVHGLGGSSTNWTDFASLLAEEVDGLAIDLPGYGGSDPAPGGDYCPAALAEVVARVIEETGRGPVHLFGNSLGGVIAVLVAARRPDLVRTLTLISPAMPDLRPDRGPRLMIGLAALPGRGRRVRDYLGVDPAVRVRTVVEACFAHPEAIPPRRLAEAVEEARREQLTPWRADAFVRSIRGLIATYLAPRGRSLWRAAGAITAPTLVLWGGADRLVSADLAERTAAAIPKSRLLVLPDVGHTAQLEAPEAAARAVLALLEDTRLGDTWR